MLAESQSIKLLGSDSEFHRTTLEQQTQKGKNINLIQEQ